MCVHSVTFLLAGRRQQRLSKTILAVALLALPLWACSRPRALQPHSGPVVLITIDALRADVVGAFGGDPGLTPHLDRFAAEASWAQPAVAASSWTVPSMASILTGLQPWRHGNWHGGRPLLDEGVETLAEAMQSAGYRTVAFRSNTWLRARFGYDQGFHDFFAFGAGKRIDARLRALTGGRDFVWIHVLPPHAPYVFREELRDRVASVLDGLPKRVRALTLEPYFDPAIELPEEKREIFWTLYQFNVAYADQVVGRLFESLRASGQWDSSLVIVTSDHGEEFGESHQITHGGNLHRVLLEVPLLIKLPRDSDWQLRPRPWVSNHRLYNTVLEIVGLEANETALPSLWREDDPPALSELYQGNGVNTFSLVEDGWQLLWQAEFAEREPQYHVARLASMKGGDSSLMIESPAEIFDRLNDSFLETRPLHGRLGAPPELELRSWSEETASGGDLAAERERTLARRLREAWHRWNGEERAPAELAARDAVQFGEEERERLRALGYVVN